MYKLTQQLQVLRFQLNELKHSQLAFLQDSLRMLTALWKHLPNSLSYQHYEQLLLEAEQRQVQSVQTRNILINQNRELQRKVKVMRDDNTMMLHQIDHLLQENQNKSSIIQTLQTDLTTLKTSYLSLQTAIDQIINPEQRKKLSVIEEVNESSRRYSQCESARNQEKEFKSKKNSFKRKALVKINPHLYFSAKQPMERTPRRTRISSKDYDNMRNSLHQKDTGIQRNYSGKQNLKMSMEDTSHSRRRDKLKTQVKEGTKERISLGGKLH